ncbi:hypothetical protein N300_15283, partial [Calypte anna]
LDFKRANFGLFKDLLGRVEWDKNMDGKGAQEIWSIFKDHLLHAQDQCVPMKRKVGKSVRRPKWMKKKLLDTLLCKNKIYRGWKQGQIPWEKYREIVREARDQVRKAKAQKEFDLARGVKGNRKKISSYVMDKRKTRENVGPLQKETGELVTQDVEKAEVLSDNFASVFTGKDPGHSLHVTEAKGKDWEKENPPTVDEEQV